MEMSSEFKSYKLNGHGLSKAQDIAQLFNNLLGTLSGVCGSNREFALARTKLEEACFFAKKAMAVLPENQDQ
jgi:hypothetical protein